MISQNDVQAAASVKQPETKTPFTFAHKTQQAGSNKCLTQ